MDSVLVFDMGGVLYDFGGSRLIAEYSRRARRFRSDEVERRWAPLMQAFGTGACSEADFASELVRSFDLNLTQRDALERFRDGGTGFYEGALELLGALRERHTLLSLSNSNAVQWPRLLAALSTADPFHAHHPSHVSGWYKPDPRAFQAIADTLPEGTRVCFFDDRARNVEAARAFGWQACRVRGVAATRAACQDLGLVDLAPQHARDHA